MKQWKQIWKRILDLFQPMEYCGMTIGWNLRLIGLFPGAAVGLMVGMVLFSNLAPELLMAAIGAIAGSVWYGKYCREKRRRDFQYQFCDYLDAVSTCLSCGKNTYDAFLNAGEEMNELYASTSPICWAAGKVTEGLQNGRTMEELLQQTAKETACMDVQTFGEIYSTCSRAGGNLKRVTDESRRKLEEKLKMESEIQTFLSGPKHELNLMTVMPFVILAALRAADREFLQADGLSVTVNLIALAIFIVSYLIGYRMVHIEL